MAFMRTSLGFSFFFPSSALSNSSVLPSIPKIFFLLFFLDYVVIKNFFAQVASRMSRTLLYRRGEDRGPTRQYHQAQQDLQSLITTTITIVMSTRVFKELFAAEVIELALGIGFWQYNSRFLFQY